MTETLNIGDISAEVAEWTTEKFGEHTPSYLSLIKAVEELGELAGAYIRRIESRDGRDYATQAEINDGVADVVITLMVFCAREGIDFNSTLLDTWQKVRPRNFEVKKEPSS